MRTATHLQLFRFKCVAFVQQKYHNSISSSRGFCRFFERKCKKSKFPVPKTFHKRNRFIQDTVNLLRLCCTSPFPGLFVTLNVLHFIFPHLFAVFFMHFSVCLFTYMHISKCNRLLCALFRSTPLPSRSPFWAAAAFGCTSATKKQHRQPFQAICAVPYSLHKKEERLRRAALPQFRLCYKKDLASVDH